MSESVRIRRNTFFSLLSISSRLIANVLLFWVIARFYGPTIFGRFTFAHSLSYIFIIFADFGFDVLLTNEIARDRNRAAQIFRQFFSLKFVFTSLSLAGMWLFMFIEGFPADSRKLMIIFSVYMVFTTLTNFLYALFKGLERLEYETKVSIFINVSLLILTLVLIYVKADIVLIATAFVFTRVLGFAVGIIYSRKLLKNITFSFIFTGFKQIKGKVFVFGFNLVFNYLFFQLDTILLALWKGDYDVGIYQSVFKLILIPLVIPDIFINTLLPVLSRLNVENIERWKRVGSVMNKILFIVIIPITIIFFVYAPQIIGLIYGAKKYAAAVPILRVFALTLFVRFNLEAYALMLTTSERQHIRMKVVIVATALNLVLNYFMIRSHGAYGAAVVSLITNSFVGLMYYLTTLPLFKEWMFNFKIISVLLFSAGFGYLCWLSAGVTVFLSAPVIAGVFILIAYYYFFSKEEKKLIIPAELNLTLIKNRFF